MSEEIEQEGTELSQGNEIQLPVEQTEVMYYAGEGFYSSLYINTAYANGFTDADLTEISWDDYNAWFNPPEGKMAVWQDGKPVLVDIPPPDYVAIATQKRNVLRAEADYAIVPLQDSVDIDEATDEEIALLKKWKAYRVALNRLDLSTAPDIAWPVKPA